MSTDICYLSAVDVLASFRNRSLSPVEYLDALLNRIDAVEPRVAAVAFRFDERAREAAKKAEAVYLSRSADPRALEGLPLAIKDDSAVAGDPWTYGSLLLKDRIADRTAPIAERAFANGAYCHIRTRTPEFCLIGQTHSRLWGVTHNPWNPAFDPGGSSGGSAAALASGMSPLSTGSDVGGSIRIPAACCGVVGYKPPSGRVPQDYPGNLDPYLHAGPLARTVADAAYLQNLIAGRHPLDLASLPKPADLPLAGSPVVGRKIAVCETLGDYLVHPDNLANLRDVGSRLKNAGAEVEYVTLPWTREKIIRAAGIHTAAYYSALWPVSLERDRDLLTESVVAYLESVQGMVTSVTMAEGLALEAEIWNGFAPVMESYDAVLAPTLAVPALDAGVSYVTERIEVGGELITRREHCMTVPFNICNRCPVLAVPSGFASNGIPTGIQIVGRAWDDASVFEVGFAIERFKPWADTWPPL
jgi:aspartyl-tRNA(Asn)/glutamyl-tRNA(Gln) amidotransferase subunit A